MRPVHVSQNDFLFLSISLFVIVAAWIGFNIYHKWVTTTITPDLQIQIIPIKGTFDTATLQKLKTRKQVSPTFTASSLVATPSVTLSPTPFPSTITPTSSPLQSLTPSPTGTTTITPTPSGIIETDIVPTEIPTPTL